MEGTRVQETSSGNSSGGGGGGGVCAHGGFCHHNTVVRKASGHLSPPSSATATTRAARSPPLRAITDVVSGNVTIALAPAVANTAAAAAGLTGRKHVSLASPLEPTAARAARVSAPQLVSATPAAAAAATGVVVANPGCLPDAAASAPTPLPQQHNKQHRQCASARPVSAAPARGSALQPPSSMSLPAHLQPTSPASPAGPAIASTAVSVQPLYTVPTSLYTHAGTAAAAAAAAAASHPRAPRSYGGWRAAAGVPPASPPVAGLGAEHTRDADDLDAIEERVRRAAERHESGNSIRAGTGASQGAPASAASAGAAAGVEVARGYRRTPPNSASAPSSPMRGPLNSGGPGVALRVGCKRRRHRPERLACAEPLHGGAAEEDANTAMSLMQLPRRLLPSRSVSSPSASSASSIGLVSPQSPQVSRVVASTTATAAGGGATSSPFGSLLHAFASPFIDSSAGPPLVGRSGVLQTRDGAAAGPPAARAPLVWIGPWEARALSQPFAAQLQRDADAESAAVAVQPRAVGPPGAAIHGLSPPHGVARSGEDAASNIGGAVAATPRTLRAALLSIFAEMEQLETHVVAAAAGAAAAGTAPATEAAVRDASPPHHHRRAQTAAAATCTGGAAQSRGGAPSSPPALSALGSPSSVLDVLLEGVRRLSRQWVAVLVTWPCEAARLGYVEGWLRHPAWTALAACASSAAPAAADSGTTTGNAPAPAAGEGQTGEERRHAPVPATSLTLSLAAAVEEGLRALLNTAIDALVRSVSDLLRDESISARRQSLRRAAASPPPAPSPPPPPQDERDTQAVRARHTTHELLRLVASLYTDPPPVLAAHLLLVPPQRNGDARVTRPGDARPPQEPQRPPQQQPQRVDDDGEVVDTATGDGRAFAASASGVAGEGRSRLPPAVPAPPHSSASSPPSSPRSAAAAVVSPLSPASPRGGAAARTPVSQLHYQLLYALCRLCNEVQLDHRAADGAEQAQEEEWRESRGAGVGGDDAAVAESLSVSRRVAPTRLLLFGTAAQLAAAMAALLVQVQLPMKGDLLCLTSRLAQWRAALERAAYLGEREYATVMGQLCALLAQAT